MSAEDGAVKGGAIPPASADNSDPVAAAEEEDLFGTDLVDRAPKMPRVPPLPPSEKAAAAAPGELAIAEEQSLSQNATPEDLAAAAATSEHHRDQHFRDAFELIAIASLNLAYFAISTLALVWSLHLVLPKQYRWLSPEDLTHLQTFLTAGVLVGLVGNHFKRRLGPIK